MKNCEDVSVLIESDLSFLPCKARECVAASFALIERNLSLIRLSKKKIEGYDARFDKEKMGLRNSQILSACHVFD